MRSINILFVATCLLAVATFAVAFDRPCNISPSLIPVCATGVSPTKNATTNCPTCRIACTLAQLQSCNVTALPTCNDDKEPELNGCCVTCKPAEVVCTSDKLDACRHAYSTLPVCATNTTAVFNKTSCCYNCRLAAPAPALKPDTSGRCTKDQFEACITTAPVCAQGEVSEKNKTQQCCPTCKRPERLCSKEELITCRNNTPACSSTQLPIYTNGECCPSCHLTRPNCTATCPTGTVCVRRLPDSATGAPRDPTCRNVTVAKLFFRASDAIRRAVIGNVSCDQLVDMVKEIVQRFCDKNENVDVCATYQESFNNLVASVNSTCRPSADGTVPVEVIVPAPVNAGSSSAAARLLSNVFATFASTSTSAATQVAAAVADPEAASGYAVTLEGTTSAATTVTSSVIFSTVLAVVAIAFRL